jgi:heat shock protein HslJ
VVSGKKRLMKTLHSLIFLCLASAASVAAQASDEDYGAIGTEPFWGLSIERGRMTFDVNDEPPVTVALPARERIPNGYRFRTPRMTVDIVRADCNDGMTDRTFADEVTVRLDGRRFEGCGGAILPPETLAGTSWRFQAIAGTRIRDDRWSINFAPETPLTDEDDFHPNTYLVHSSCSESRGPYSRSGNVLRLGPVRSIRRACTQRERNIDARMRQILSRPLRIAFPPDGTFVLTNERGILTLTP